jgi:mannan endo-1,4-beta-mannosidase
VGIEHRNFVLDRAAFRFACANNYYLIYKSRFMADAVFEAARDLGLRAIRTWGFIDRGSLDGTVADSDPPGHKDGVYFQHWDPQRGAPAYNDGSDGLERLDYVVHRAAELGLKLIIPPNRVAHLLDRINTLTGRRCADEPAILAWEFANEPRCPSSAAVLLRWVDQMRSFIRDLDSRHLVAAGDEGFFRRRWSGE